MHPDSNMQYGRDHDRAVQPPAKVLGGNQEHHAKKSLPLPSQKTPTNAAQALEPVADDKW